jgi:hypothetical protein
MKFFYAAFIIVACSAHATPVIELDSLGAFDQYLRAKKFSGVISARIGDKKIFEKVYGARAVADNRLDQACYRVDQDYHARPMHCIRRDDVFQIGSNTKQMVSAASY